MADSYKDQLKKMFLPAEKVAVFIDGNNLWWTMNNLDWQLDFKLLRDVLGECGRLMRIYYYTGLKDTGEHDAVRSMADWLDQNGYTVISKPVKYQTNATGGYTMKGNMDVEIAVDMLKMSAVCDHMVLFSGDGDFRYLVEALQSRGKRVSVASTREAKTNSLSNDLRRQADNFIELNSLKPFCHRDATERTRAALAIRS